jgi:hypothetical protein
VLHYLLTPVLFITAGSYLVASAFFSVYSMAVDTLFLCFLEDLERNDGSKERPYFMSQSLRRILGKMEGVARRQATGPPASSGRGGRGAPGVFHTGLADSLRWGALRASCMGRC